MLYYFTCMWNPKDKTNRLTDTENNLVVARGEGSGGNGRNRGRGLKYTNF